MKNNNKKDKNVTASNRRVCARVAESKIMMPNQEVES